MWFCASISKSNHHHQRPEPQRDRHQNWERDTAQVQSRRGVDRPRIRVHRWVLLPNPVLQPRPHAVSGAPAWACVYVSVSTLCSLWLMSWCHLCRHEATRLRKRHVASPKPARCWPTKNPSSSLGTLTQPRAAASPACGLGCASLSMRICVCKHPLLSLTHVVVSSQPSCCWQGSERGTSQVQSRRGVDRPRSWVHRSVLFRQRFRKRGTSQVQSWRGVEELVTEMEILEDEVDMHAVQDQRGDTKYTYKVSVGVLRKSCCVCSRMGLCHCNIILINYPNLCSTWLVLNWAKLLEVESSWT